MKHTPGKLTVQKHNRRVLQDWGGPGPAAAYVTATDTLLVAEGGEHPTCIATLDVSTEMDANARRLALCWNTHDELVAALRNLLANVTTWDGDPSRACTQARAVLAKLSAVP